MPLLPIVFTKMSGAGNSFVLIDARPGAAWALLEPQLGVTRAEFSKKICSHPLGVGADGALWIESGNGEADFVWDFYNSDGSTAEMCGNAARCAARFCVESLSVGPNKSIRFKTGAGLVTAEVLGEGVVRVYMPEARILQRDLQLKGVSSDVEKYTLVNTGVPHLVKKIADINSVYSLREDARTVRHHPALQPAGANVTYFCEQSLGEIEAVTYERGVENFTQACGTGAVAAALVYGEQAQVKDVKVQMPGGCLQVSFDHQGPRPEMTGDALFIGEFRYNVEVIK